MAPITVLIPLALALVIFALIKLVFPRNKRKLPLPPGPKPRPIVGNLFDLPAEGGPDHEHWAKHKDLYGPLSSLSFLGVTLVIINDSDIALELFETRGSINSGRPYSVFANDVVGFGEFLGQQQYDAKLRSYRKRASQTMGSMKAASKFHPLQDTESRRFLLRTLNAPEKWTEHLLTQAGAVILRAIYGYHINPHGPDEFVSRAEEGVRQFVLSVTPGKWMVDNIPALRYVPAWFPGAGFKRTALGWRAHIKKTIDPPINFVKRRMAAGDYEPSFVSDNYLKAKNGLSAKDEEEVKYAAASMYLAGADTTSATLEVFFLAMTSHPEIQRKAQEEIERVVGTHRLPSMDDREQLPYVDAIVSESLRWYPIVPSGFPHVADRDNEYDGYLIPKNAIMIPNFWVFSQDTKAYPDPSRFDPERFLTDPPAPDPRRFVFGYGRRICVGILLADATVWLTIAKTLAAFDIKRPLDKEGREIVPKAEFIPGFLSRPARFETVIRPRSKHHETLIRAVEVEHPWEKGDAFVDE